MSREKGEGEWGWRYNPGMVDLGYKLALLGATDKEMAMVFEVDPVTIGYWKRTKLEFKEALQRGKIEVDMKVAESLFKCAVGYEYE